MNDEEIERLRIFAEITGDHDQVPVAGRMMHKLSDAIDQLRKQRDTARLEGWQAAREMAAKVCSEEADGWDAVRHNGLTLIHQIANDEARKCATLIRAMQPPSEWQCAEVTPACGDAPNIEWKHPDGFGGGLTERRIDDGEGEESKKAT